MPAERLLADLRTGRQRLSMNINEARTAVEEHHLAWQRLNLRQAEAYSDGEPTGVNANVAGDADTGHEVDMERRREAFYLGQAVALTWAMQMLDSALQRHGSQAAGRVFSCPISMPIDTILGEEPWQRETARSARHDVDQFDGPAAGG